MDVYYPLTTPENGGKTPTLFFWYGGAFYAGGRRLAPPFDLAYACLGAFFAQQGFMTIIADYRLVDITSLAPNPETRYPAPPEDMRDAMVWVTQNADKLKFRTVPNPDVDNLFLLAHSAGAVHMMCCMLHPTVLEGTDLRTRIKGIIPTAAGYHLFPTGYTLQGDDILTYYFGDEEQKRQRAPLGLLQAASQEFIDALPELVMVEAQREPDWMKEVGADFRAAWAERTGKTPKKVIGKGHNHISMNWALSTGQGEEWALEVARWIKEKRKAIGADP